MRKIFVAFAVLCQALALYSMVNAAKESQLPTSLNRSFMQANELLAKGDYSGAMDKLTAILLRDPGNGVAREQIYQIAQMMSANAASMGQMRSVFTPDERADAVELAYKSLRKASPRLLERRLQDAALQERRKFYLLACQIYISILQLPGLELEKKYQVEKRLRSASQKVDSKIETLPEESRATYREAFTLMNVGDWEGSVESWQKYVEKHPADTEVNKLLSSSEAKAILGEKEKLKQAYAALETLEIEKAEKLFDEALKINPNSAEASKGLEIAQQKGEQSQRTKFITGLLAKAERLAVDDKKYQALQILTGALKEDPSDQRVLSMIQNLMEQAGVQKTVIVTRPVIQRVVEKQEQADRAVAARDTGKAETHYQKGLVYYSLRNYREAFSEWKAAVQYDPNSRKISQALQRVQSDLQYEKSK